MIQRFAGALVALCAGDPDVAARTLGLGATQADEVPRNAALRDAPTARADAVYAGVLYEARVSAFGPGGTAASDPSNSFSFSAPCAPSLASTGLSVPAAGGTGSVGMNAAEGCLWTAVSNVAWITISSGSSGSGDGVISFSVAANPNSSSRTGTITER